MVPRSAEWDRVVPGGDGADIGEPLNYATTIAIPVKLERVEQPRTACGAEECRVVPGGGGADIGVPLNYSTTIEIPRGPSSAGRGWGRHWGAFKLLYYH